MSGAITCVAIAARHKLHRAGRGWRGACPVCGYRDALKLDEGAGGKPLVYAFCNCPQTLLMRDIGQEPRLHDQADDAKREAERSRKRDAALRLWRGSEPAPGTLAAAYLAHRNVGHLADCPDIRFRGDCGHPEGGRLPAVVALVRGPDGEPVGVWRTYIRHDGRAKAAIEPPRAGLGVVWGAAVRLAPVASAMVVGEGIESAAAAGILAGLPAWAALSAGNLAKGLMLPVAIRSVLVAVDRDIVGERAARAACRRWEAEGRRVQLLVPDLPGSDAADVLAARIRGNA